MSDPVVITGFARTPMGAFQGAFADVPAHQLGATAIDAALERAKVSDDAVDQVIMGCVLPAGQGQAPARQSALGACLPLGAEATTINKMCGSGLQAAVMGRQSIAAGNASIVIVGGMESMTNAPHLLDVRQGHKYGDMSAKDHMALDGLTDAYAGGPMGVFADMIAEKFQFTREQQDAYALETLKRAQTAAEGGKFKREIAPVTIKTRKGETTVEADELPRYGVEALDMGTVRPARDGRHD